MAVLGRVLISSGERLDLPDLLGIDSYTAGDFKYLIKSLIGDSNPYVLKGFDVIDPQNAIGTQSCSIKVAESVVFYPGSNTGSFYCGLEEGNPEAEPLVPELRKNAINYVYLTFSTANTSTDTRAFWDPDKDGGAGGEFTQDVNTESVLKVEVNVSVGSFPQNTIPIAKITVGPVVITAIEDARSMLFRLGSGGINPNPFNTYAWRSLPTAQYQRKEPSTKIIAGGVNPFQGADKNIYTLKEWMDVVMSKLREIGGTTYWYEDASTYSLISGFIDAAATAFKSKGKWLHDSSTPGLLTWTEDLHLKIASDPRTYIVRSGSKTLTDEQVMYLSMIKKQSINATDDAVDWVNGQSYVNTVGGAVGLFANLTKGDYVKKINDSNDKFLRVEEFYDSINLSGSTTTPGNAKSIRLNSNYLGTTGAEKGTYDKGVYDSTDVVVSDRDQSAISAAGGNFHWLALRSDTIQEIASINNTALTINIEEHDGTTAKVTSSGAHGLVDGDRIRVFPSNNFNGTYVVEVESSTVFYINVSGGPYPDELAVSAKYITVVTGSRSTAYGLQLESANHNFQSNDTIKISGTLNYNGVYQINVRDATTFTIPDQYGLIGLENAGSATLARTIVRTEGSVAQIVQGGMASIGGDPATSIKQYVGMQSLSETNPSYSISPSYNTIDGFVNYNSVINENLTARVSKLTAMMADKAQDKTIKLAPSGYQSVTNTTVGINQRISFNATPTGTPRLDVALPSSTNNGYVLLSGYISLQTNQAAYIQIDRNNAFSFANLAAVTVANIKSVPLDEGVLVLAVRLSGTDVWLWDGLNVPAGSPVPTIVYLDTMLKQNRTMKMVAGGQWTWNLATNSLSWSSDAYVQIPSISQTRNTIQASSVTLSSDGVVAYVDVNRSTGATTNLIVSASNISSLALHDDRVIIARRVGNDVIVGSESMVIMHGDSKSLDSDDRTIKVTVIDAINTTLPTGASVTIDGISLVDGDTVLFTKSAIDSIYMVSGIGTSATWTQLKYFNGSTAAFNGATVFAKSGTSAFSTMWTRIGGFWRQLEHTQVTSEPTGFPNRTDSTISFVNGTRTFSISPTSSYFDVYQAGKPYRFNSSQSLVIPDTEGLHYIYFNNGTLQSTQTFDISIIKQYAFTATIQWDATNKVRIMFGDERHGLTMDGETHSYLHQSIGARYISGLSAGNFTTSGTGNANSDAQLSIADGVVRDEDISFSYTNSASPSQPFEQILSPIANIPMYYRSGASGNWRKDAATAYSLKQGTSRIKWNDPSGPWTTPDASLDGNYVAVWVFSSNSKEEPIIGIVGQREDTTLNNAQANNTYESLSFGSLPSLELKVLYRLIFQTSSTYTNAVKARLVDVRDLRRAVDVSLGAYAPSDHGLLTGLTDQDHPDYAIYVSNPSAYVGGLKQINVSDNNDVQKALNSLDRFFAQMRLSPHPSNGNRVVMSGADQLLTNGITLTQNIKNLMVSFDGAQIDFSTGSIYKADGVTALGVNFTPATIASNQYRWYSISAIASSVNVDNTINLQLAVSAATADGATPTAAPKAAYAKGIQVGSVVVRENGSGGITAITASSIKQLGTGGSGSGSGDGDANELLERIKDRVINAPFDWAEPNIFSTDEDDKISSATATFDVANTLYKFTAIGQNITSIQSLDPEFLTEEKDVDSAELMAFWNQGYVDSNATYEISRNGGNNWSTVTMTRVGTTSDTFRGIYSFPQDTTYSTLYEHAVANATAYRELNSTTLQAISQRFVVSSGTEQVLQKPTLYINKVESSGTLTGTVYINLIRDSGSNLPSTNTLDVVVQTQVLCSSLAVGDNAISLSWGTTVLKAGTYHYAISTDSNYKTSFSAGVRSVRARVDSVLPIGTYGIGELSSGVWAANNAQTLIHKIEGRSLDLRVRVTSSASNVQLKGYGILYGRQSQIQGGIKNREVQSFDGTINNYNEFTLSNFLPDPDLLKIYHVETGQVYVRNTNSFYLDGRKVIFPANTFNGLGTVTLVFDQLQGASFDNSENNGALLAANFLGSTDATIDRSQAGRGILLRRPDGTLREITINNSDQIVIYSV